MKVIIFVLFALVICLFLWGCLNDNSDSVSWNTDIAQTPDAISMYFFSSEQCGFCERIKDNHFKSNKIVSYLNKNFICINIIQGESLSTDLMNQFKISVFPTFLFLNKSGIEEARITGYIEEDVFLNRLKDINAGINILDYYIEKNRTEGGGKYLLEIFNVYGKRKDAENLEATATRIRTEAPELYGAREEYIISALADVMYANRMYESFIPQMETLLSYKVERLLRNDYLKMATAFSRSGRYGDAERIHLLLIKLLPGDITVLTDYLRFLAVNGLIAEPSAVIEGVGFMEPEASEWAEYYYWLSRYYQAIGDSENSGVFMAKAAELAPERYSQVGLFLVYPEKIIYPAVEEGVVLKAELEISNPTGDELELHVMSTCSCLTVSENSLLLKNGETMSVTAVLDTSGESGLIERVLIFRPTSGDRFFEQTVSFKVIVN